MGNLNPKWELFCRYYTQNQELFGNATHSYAEAYDYQLYTLSHEDAVWGDVDDGKGGTKNKCIEKSSYDKAINVCAVEGARLLRTPKIQARITVLLNEILKDDVVDSQLAKMIMQDDDTTAKIAAIREYNKLKQRIIEKKDITTGGDKIDFSKIDPKQRALLEDYEDKLKDVL